MNKKKQIQKLSALITLGISALIGLIFVQIHWINKAADLHKKQFNYQVSDALLWATEEIAHAVNAYNIDVEKYHVQKREKEAVEDILTRLNIDSILTYVFTYRHLPTDFTYTLKYQGSQCRNTEYRCLLRKSIPKSNFDLIVDFPNRQTAVMKSMKGTLGISLFFILLSGLSLFMMLKTAIKQRKQSEMTEDFINNMTHELKTPMASIKLASGMLMKENIRSMDTKVEEYSTIIRAENNKLQQHVEKVLQLCQIERKELQFSSEELVLNTLISTVVAGFELRIREADGKIMVNTPDEDIRVKADPYLLSNALNNMIDNAIKYSSIVDIQVSLSLREEYASIDISDKGKGISREDQKFIFDKFYRVSTGNLHCTKGFGLGLAYVKEIMDLHNGTIAISSKPGKGSVFTIKLPLS